MLKVILDLLSWIRIQLCTPKTDPDLGDPNQNRSRSRMPNQYGTDPCDSQNFCMTVNFYFHFKLFFFVKKGKRDLLIRIKMRIRIQGLQNADPDPWTSKIRIRIHGRQKYGSRSGFETLSFGIQNIFEKVPDRICLSTLCVNFYIATVRFGGAPIQNISGY